LTKKRRKIKNKPDQFAHPKMQSDEIVWQVINQHFCSFKVRMDRQNFCKNEYNLTGLCLRSACPLANSQYATLKEEGGKVYLLVKTVERAHTPKDLWEKTLLPRSVEPRFVLSRGLGGVDILNSCMHCVDNHVHVCISGVVWSRCESAKGGPGLDG
jgi:hypothetical protein